MKKKEAKTLLDYIKSCETETTAWLCYNETRHLKQMIKDMVN